MAGEWHAVGALNRALEETNSLLFKKVKFVFWLKLALVVFLVGGGGFFNPTSFVGNENRSDVDLMRYLPLVVVVFSVIVIIGLVFSFIRAVCQFMFIDALVDGRIEIVKGFKRNLDNGFSLFLFNLALGFATIAAVIAILMPAVYYMFLSGAEVSRPVTFVGMLLMMCIVLPIALASGIIGSFTNEFVTVLMYKNRKGVVYCWKRLIGLIKNNTKEFVVYMVVRIACGIAASIILFIVEIVVTIVAIIVAIVPVVGFIVIVGGSAIALDWGTSALMWLLIPAVVAAIAYLWVVSYIIVALTLPIPVFFRYYSMLFLHRIEPTLGIMAGRVDKVERQEKEADGSAVKTKPGKKLRVY